MAEIAALMGDPGRANMLTALVGGRALSASELAYFAHVSPQTASGHLARLAQARLLTVERRGRNRYYRLAGPLVAEALEAIMRLAAAGAGRRRLPSPEDARLRLARTCYDHLAGRLGVALTDALVLRHCLTPRPGAFGLTPAGETLLVRFGLSLADLRCQRRVFARPCLDWSERRPHLAGALGAALAERCLTLGWVARIRDGRSLLVTVAGRRGFSQLFQVDPTIFAGPPVRD